MAAVRLRKDCYFFVMRNSMVFPSAYSFALRSECTDLAERQRFATERLEFSRRLPSSDLPSSSTAFCPGAPAPASHRKSFPPRKTHILPGSSTQGSLLQFPAKGMEHRKTLRSIHPENSLPAFQMTPAALLCSEKFCDSVSDCRSNLPVECDSFPDHLPLIL